MHGHRDVAHGGEERKGDLTRVSLERGTKGVNDCFSILWLVVFPIQLT